MKKVLKRLLLWVSVTIGVLLFCVLAVVVSLFMLEDVKTVPGYSNDKLTELPVSVVTDKKRYEHTDVVRVTVTNESEVVVTVDPEPYYLTRVNSYQHEWIPYKTCSPGEYKQWPKVPKELKPGDAYSFRLWTEGACEEKFGKEQVDGREFQFGHDLWNVYVPLQVGEPARLEYAVSKSFSVKGTLTEEILREINAP